MKQKFAVRELAFLSACQTSAGKEKLSREALHGGYSQLDIEVWWQVCD